MGIHTGGEPRPETMTGGGVRVLGADAAPEVVSVLSEAFYDYPVVRFVLGNDGDYDARLDTLVRFFVGARVLRGETMLGIGSGGLVAAALVSNPGLSFEDDPVAEIRRTTWARLGDDARARYAAFGATAGAIRIEVEHIHLNMIGVRRAAQGRGFARELLEATHAMSGADPASNGVSLTTEVEDNVSLYEHFGYEVVGRGEVEGAFSTWTMFREDRDS